MQHKLIVATFGGLDVAFLAESVEKYFKIDRPFKIPGVEKSISWIQGVRGKCVTLFHWWETLGSIGVVSFLPVAVDKTSADFANAVLFNCGSSQLGFPVSDVMCLVEVDNSVLTSAHHVATDPSIVGVYNGMFVIDPALLFRNHCSSRKPA